MRRRQGVKNDGTVHEGWKIRVAHGTRAYLAVDQRVTDVRDHLVRYQMTRQSIECTRQRVVEETKALAPEFASSAVKLSNALNIQDGDELIVKAMGSDGFRWDDVEDGEARSAIKRWLYQKSLTIAGGTQEVQLNIIAKRVLDLPD